MNLYKFQPRQYVDVLPDLPLEWLQGQVDKKQGVINAQRDELNKAAENYLKLNYGTFGRDLYDQVNKDYQGKFKQMSEDLLTRQDIPGVASSFSNLVREAAFDPRIKDLNKEFAAYQKYLETKMNPEYSGAIDLTQYGKQIGEDFNVDQAIAQYPLVKYEDSIQPYVATAEKFKPYKDVKTDKWVFNNPISGETFVRDTKEEIEQVSKPRLQEYFEGQYYNWNMDARSKYDKLKGTNVDLNQFDPNFNFKDEDLGRDIWRKKYLPYLQMAYTQRGEETKVTPMGGGKPTSANDPNKPPADVKPLEYNMMTPMYGIGVLGNRLSTGEEIRTYDDAIGNIQDHKNRISTLVRQMFEASEKGDNATVLTLDKERQNVMSDLTTWESWQKLIEEDLYNKNLGQGLSNALKLEKDWIESHSGQIADFGALSLIYKKPVEQIKNDILYKRDTTYEGVDYDEIDDFLEEASKIRRANLKGDASKLYEKWEKYLNYQTQGTSYQPYTDAAKQRLDGMITSLITSGKKPYNLKTDKEVSDFKALQEYLLKLQAENGSFNTKGLSTEILLDEEDGPVLILHGLNIDGSKGEDIPNSIEFDIRDTPSLLNVLYEIDPSMQTRNTYFVEAAKSLKENKNKKGSFTLNSYGNVQEEVSFSRVPIGDGKYMFKDSDNVMYASLNDLIQTKILGAAEEDKNIQVARQEFSKKFNEAVISENDELIKEARANAQNFERILEKELKQKREGKLKQWTVRPSNPLQ
jgi:hypothetical protein